MGGYVAAIKESFGFIEPVNAADLPAQLYFNFGAVLRRDELRVGDEVHFEVDSGRDGRSSAVRVQLLKPGTLPPPPRAKGVVERAPNRQGFGGRISYAASEGAAPESVSFEGRDVRERDPLDAGDLVEFVLAADHRGGGKCARQVKVLERGGGLPRERGVVVSMKDDRQFGFIRAEEGGAAQVRNSGAILRNSVRNSAQFSERPSILLLQLFFHYQQLPQQGAADVRVGTEVSFIRSSDQRTKKEQANRLEVLPPGTVAFERIGTDVVVAIVTRALPPHSRLDGGASRAEKHAHGGLLRVVGDGDGDGDADGDGDGEAEADANGEAAAADGAAPAEAAAPAPAPAAAAGARRARAGGGREEGNEEVVNVVG